MNLKQLVDDTIKNIRGQAMQRTTQTLANVQRGFGTMALNAQTGVKNVRSGFAPIVNPIANTLKQGSQALGRASFSQNPINVLANNQQRQQQVLGATLPQYSGSKQSFQDILTAGKGKLATAGLLQSPLSVLGFGATSAGFQGLSNIASKKPITQGMPQALGQGLNMGAIANPIIRGTNPILLKGMSSLPFSNQIATRTAAGIGNVLQGEVLGKSGMGNNTLGRGIDFATGFIGGKGTFQNPIPKTQQVDVNAFVQYAGKEGKQLIFKPKKIMDKQNIGVVDNILEQVGKTKDLSYVNWMDLKAVVKSITGASDEALNKLSPNKLINEAVRHTNLADGFYNQNAVKTGMALSNQSRGKIRDVVKLAINQAPSQDKAISRINNLVDVAMSAPKNKDYIQKLKTVRAELNRQMYSLTGADIGNYKTNYAVLQKAKENPEIAGLIDNIENQIIRIDDVIKSPTKIVKPVAQAPGGGGIEDLAIRKNSPQELAYDLARKLNNFELGDIKLSKEQKIELQQWDNKYGNKIMSTGLPSVKESPQWIKDIWNKTQVIKPVSQALVSGEAKKIQDVLNKLEFDGDPYNIKPRLTSDEQKILDGFYAYTSRPEVDAKYQAGAKDPEIIQDYLKQKAAPVSDIRVYHGSENKYNSIPDIPITKSDNKGNQSALGMWFSPKKEIAEFYGSNVIESKLNLNNPKIYEAKEFNLMKGKVDFLELRKQLESQGYDGVYVKSGKGSNAEYAVFNSKSISPSTPPAPVSGAVKTQNALVKTGKPGALVAQQAQQPLAKPTQTGVLQPSVKPSQSVNPQTGLPGGGQIPPKLNKSGQNVGGNQTKDLSYKVTDRLYTEFVDRFHPISKLAKVAGKDKETARAIAGYYGSGSTANYHLQQELSPILKEQNITDLKEAAIAMRDVELSNRGIKGSPEQIQAQTKLQNLTTKLGSQKMQELGATLQKLYAYQDEMVKRYMVDTGIMSKSGYQAMRKNNQFYVPMKRVMDKVDDFLGIPIKRGAGSMGKQNVIYGIKGSDKEIIDPIESIVENTYKLVSLGKRQEVAQTISGLRKEMPNVITRALKSDQQNTIGVFENGKKVFYNVPEEVADAARGMGEEQLVTLTKILKVPTDLFRTMTTGVNPEFLMPNVSRDVQSSLFNAGVNPLKWVSGLAHFLKQDQVYKDFLKSGGKTSRISINRPYLKQTAEELAGNGFSIKSPKDIVRGLEMLSEVSEQPTRIAVFEDAYKRSLKQGMSQEEALREAAYWAQEGTVNFARRGSKMTNINAIYAYLNARVQGVDRMIRTAKKEPGKAVVRWGFGMLAPSLALYAWNNSGERGNRYNDERILSKRDKEDNFIFMLPQTKNGVDYLKIPKSEIAKVVNPVETFLDYAQGKGGDIAGSVASLVKSFSPIDNVGGLIPTAISPVVENAMNKDFYTGYDLVPEYKKSLPKGYQDSNYTSPVFRMIGQKTNQSPALIQNIAESYGGGMVRIAEMASQPLIDKKYVSAKNTQGAEINRTPVLRRFMGGEKKTETEQIKANISRQNAIKFQINDVKSAIRRGDIPADVGYQQIVKLMGEMPVTQPTTQTTPMKQVLIPTVKQTPIPMPTGPGIGGGKRKKISIKKPKQVKIKLKGFKKATQKKMKAVKIKKPKNIRIVTSKNKKS